MIAPVPTTIAEHNGWRLVSGIAGWEFPIVQIQRPDGTWFWPDCGWKCDACDVCLGCARKMVHGHMEAWAESGDDIAMLQMELDCQSFYGGRCTGTDDGRHVVAVQDDDD